MTDIEAVLSDLLHASLDDCRVRLPPLTERKILARMVALAECAGVEMTRPEPEPQQLTIDDPSEWF